MYVGRIKIDGQSLDLAPGEIVAVDLQADSLENVGAIQSSYTAEFSVPLTLNNRQILGRLGALDSIGTEYNATACTVYDTDGNVVTANGLLLIDRVQGEYLICNVLQGAVGFFDELDGATLQMLGIASIGTPVPRTEPNVVANIDNDYTSGFTYGTFNFGDNPTTTYTVAKMWPASFFHAIFEAIEALTSYTFDTSTGLFADAFFRKCFLAYSGSNYNEEQWFIGDLTGYTITAGTAGPGVYVKVTPQAFDLQNAFFDSVGRFTVKEERKALVFNAYADITITTTAGAYEYNVRIYNRTQSTTLASYSSGAITGAGASVNVTFDIDSGLYKGYNNGDIIELQIDAVTGLNFDFTSGYFRSDGIDRNGNNAYNKPASGDNLDPLTLMPDMDCVEFMKGVCNLFMARFEIDEAAKTITLPMFKDYSQDTANAPIWGSKVDGLRTLEVEYKFGQWASANQFKYVQDDEVPAEFGNGTFFIVNAQLPTDPAVIIELPFGSSTEGTVGGKMYVPILSGSDIANELTPRIGYAESVTGSITVGATPVTDYNEARFRALAWQLTETTGSPPTVTDSGMLGDYWTELQEAVQNMEKVTAYLKLNPADIAELDFFTPKYINYTNNVLAFNGFFFLQLVKEYRGDGTVECELINLNIS
jgi:hypothetical protein